MIESFACNLNRNKFAFPNSIGDKNRTDGIINWEDNYSGNIATGNTATSDLKIG